MNTLQTEEKIYKCINKIIGILISTIFLIAIILIMSLTLQKIIYKDKVPTVFGYKILQVMSGSMTGEFETGDTILIKAVNNENQLNIGDVVTYKVEKNTLVTHRIVNITKEKNNIKYTTKGDANNTNDKEKIDFSDIEGKYICKVIIIGKLISIMKNPFGMALIFTIPIIAIILIIIKEKKEILKKNMRKEKRLNYEFNKAKEELGGSNGEEKPY